MINETTIRIFLVDDDEIDAMSFERALRKSGLNFLLTHCKDANQAMDEIHKVDYDCVFLDYQLPGFDGLVLLKKFKEAGITAPIAVMTSQGDEKIAVEMMKAGAFDYFPKAEVNPENMLKIVRAGMRLREMEIQKLQAERALKENNTKLNAILESTNALVFSIDSNLNYTAFNTIYKKMVCNLFGTEPFLGLPAVDSFTFEANRKLISDSFQRVLKGEHLSVTEEFGDPENKSNYYDLLFNPIVGEDGKINGVVVYGQDITDRKKVEWEILESKLEAERTEKSVLSKQLIPRNDAEPILTD